MAKQPMVSLNSRIPKEEKRFIEDVAFKLDISMSQIISDGALKEAKRLIKEFDKNKEK